MASGGFFPSSRQKKLKVSGKYELRNRENATKNAGHLSFPNLVVSGGPDAPSTRGAKAINSGPSRNEKQALRPPRRLADARRAARAGHTVE